MSLGIIIMESERNNVRMIALNVDGSLKSNLYLRQIFVTKSF